MIGCVKDVWRQSDAIQPSLWQKLDLDAMLVPQRCHEHLTIDACRKVERDQGRRQRPRRRANDFADAELSQTRVDPVSQLNVVGFDSPDAGGGNRVEGNAQSDGAGQVADASRFIVLRAAVLELNWVNNAFGLACQIQQACALRCHEPLVSTRRVRVTPKRFHVHVNSADCLCTINNAIDPA